MALEVKFVDLDGPVSKPRLTDEQKRFSHHCMALERIGEGLFGEKYYKAIDRSDMAFWKTLYVSTFEVLKASALPSIGSVDKQHRKAIEDELDEALERLKISSAKDEINASVIASLFKLAFLLLGGSLYRAKGKRRNLSTFRTMTYCQTNEQLSWLLQGHIQMNAPKHGFEDSVDADLAYLRWTQIKKRTHSDRSAYVDWVQETFPKTLAEFR